MGAKPSTRRQSPLYRLALLQQQKVLGADHPEIALSLSNLARVLIAQGRRAAAIPLMYEATRIREEQLRTTSSETRVQALLDWMRHEEDNIYGLLLTSAGDLATQQIALTIALLRKGRTAEAGTIANLLLHRNLTDVALRERFAEWQTVRQQRAALLNGGLGELTSLTYRARLRELQLHADSLEARLSAELPELRKLQPPAIDVILPAITKRLSASGVLVEVVLAQPFRMADPQCEEKKPHYVAMLLFPNQRIVSVDLGLAAEIDTSCRVLLQDLHNPSTDPQKAAQALYQQVLQPLLPHLAQSTELYLSLDGMLNLIPFHALHDGKDYLLGRYPLSLSDEPVAICFTSRRALYRRRLFCSRIPTSEESM